MEFTVIRNLCVAVLTPLLFLSCNSPQIPGIARYGVGIQNQHLYVNFVASSLHIDVGVTVPIPNLPGATVGVNPYLPAPGETGGTLFEFDVDLTQLKEKNFDVAGLPDGRALPDIAGGALPRWTFTVKGVALDLYLGNGAFAIFVPVDLSADGYSLPAMISEEVDDTRGNEIGKLYAIPTQGGATVSGVLILLPFIPQ